MEKSELRRARKPAADYSEDEKRALIEDVLSGMAEGRTMSDTVSEYGLSAGTVRRWIARDEDLFWEYKAARMLMAQAFAEEAIQTARMATNQTVTADRVRIDALQWAATRLNPMEFGDKQTIQTEGKQTVESRVVEEEPLRRLTPAQVGAASVKALKA